MSPHLASSMGHKRTATMTSAPAAVKELSRWIRSRSVRVKVALTALMAVISLLFLKLFVKRHNQFFIASQFAHTVGLFVLLYKLSISKTCSGLSLKMQELTAMFLVGRLVSFLSIEVGIHLVLDSLSLAATLWVIYRMRFKLKSTYMEKLDNLPRYCVLVPCSILAIIAHPNGAFSNIFFKILWSFTMTVEAVSVLPQLFLLWNSKVVEPFTAHYVFALGVARFFQFANWIIQLIETRGAYFMLVGQGHWWILLALVSEALNTFLLSDFCYYYVKSIMEGQVIMRLPTNV